MELVYLMYLSWLFLLQKVFEGVFAGKNKRVPHMVNMENFFDFMLFNMSIFYVTVVLKDYRYDTFLRSLTP
jgi:hypothetical protein